jgi:hypothetical protein
MGNASHGEVEVDLKQETDMKTMACQEMEARLEEEELTSVDRKPEVAEQREVPIEDATVMLVVEPEEETSNSRKETMAYQEMEACLEEKEPTSVYRKPKVAQQREVPENDAEVMLVREPKKKRRRDRKLAAERCRQIRERTQDGCQRRLAAAHKGTSHRAEVARKMQADKKMPRRATVARRMRDIFRPNTTHRAKVAWCKRNVFRKSTMQENWGSHDELATNRNMTSRAGVTRRKVDFAKNYSRKKKKKRTPSRKKRRHCKNSIRRKGTGMHR